MMGALRKKSFGKWAKSGRCLAFGHFNYHHLLFGLLREQAIQLIWQLRSKGTRIILRLRLISLPTVTLLVGLSSAIERNGNIYTLTADMNQELVISRSNIVFDGKGFTMGMQNTANNHQTIALSSVKNVTVRDIDIVGTYFAISLQHAQNNTI